MAGYKTNLTFSILTVPARNYITHLFLEIITYLHCFAGYRKIVLLSAISTAFVMNTITAVVIQVGQDWTAVYKHVFNSVCMDIATAIPGFVSVSLGSLVSKLQLIIVEMCLPSKCKSINRIGSPIVD